MTDLIQITPDMDLEDRNVAHSQNAKRLYLAGDLAGAANEVSLDRGFGGTFGQWLEWAKTVHRMPV